MCAPCVGRPQQTERKGGAGKQERNGRGCAPRERGLGAGHQGQHSPCARADMQAWQRTGGGQRRFARAELAHEEEKTTLREG
jgi:hypothetical protein